MHAAPRDTAALLARTLAQWQASGPPDAATPPDLLLFAYGSLIWRPDFDYSECKLARVQGYHRALRMRSRVNRGCPEQPGLVLALLSGGSCRGLVFRVPGSRGEAVLRQLWEREMPNGVYEPRWLSCETADGPWRALAFTLSRRSPNWTGAIDDADLVHIFRHARGRYGTTLDYLLRTVQGLRAHGIHDAELERQWHLAARHGLCLPLLEPSP
ncbi:gamma-glutamylcyclotransferase [Roseateles violae]|uniref:glutathione-specific gamma-glutamylcyclotransferase n=1 Tax=Roseateles violae TaxID=3058042 RepID=A0ABT8DQE4_9BURK|nr:gamma-glutamylcyclotransferase [Pelomonas sp. PFR6]MDN3920575.1 gamma-glutamylcyclotransferase [Pelomonas sp. PFR6]